MSLYLLLQAVMTSKTGTVNNIIQVKRTDFEVFDALRLDSQDSDISGADRQIKSLRVLSCGLCLLYLCDLSLL